MKEKDKLPQRILFVAQSAWSEHGGIQRFNRRVASALDGSETRTKIMTLNDRQSDMPLNSSLSQYWGFSGSIFRFAKAFVQEARNFDVLLLGHVNLAPLALIYKTLKPRGNVVLFAHGVEVWNEPRYRTVRAWEPLLLRRTVDRIAIVSRYSQRRMSKAFCIPNDKFLLFPNAINVPQRPDVRISVHRSKILVVSRLASSELEKHVDKVILALPGVCRTLPDTRLTIIGDGSMRPGLEDLARRLGVSENITFKGFVSESEINHAYGEADVFVLPSSKEGFGIVYLEAWARGLPVIASRFGAAPEVVTDGVDGFTVDPADIRELTERLLELLTKPSLADSFAAAGWQKLEQLYSNEAFYDRLHELCAI